MKCVALKASNGTWVGATDEDNVILGKMRRRMKTCKPGVWMRMEWTQMRHGPQHRKFFALLQLIRENSETFNTIEKALVAVKLCVGHFDLVVDPTTGEITKQTRSISYENMEQGEFDVFYSQAIDAVLQHILPQLERRTADELLEIIIEGWVAR